MSKIADKMFMILSLFTVDRPRLSIDEMAQASGLPRSTIYRFLSYLLKNDLLTKDNSNQTYRLGPAIIRLGRVAEAGLDFRALAIPWMEKLCEKTGETVFLSIPFGTSFLCIENRERSGGIKVSFHVGDTGPLYAGAAGKVLLAYLNESELNHLLAKIRLIKITPKTVTDRSKLLMQLSEIRNHGYCYTEEEHNPGVWGIGAPLLNAHGTAEAVMTISGVLDLKCKPRIVDYLKPLLEATQNISKKLGFAP